MDTPGPPPPRGVRKSDLDEIAKLEYIAFDGNALDRSALDVYFDACGGLWLLMQDHEGTWGHSINVRGEDVHVGWILGMAIHPDRKRRGWGRMLLEATIRRLRDSDVNTIRLLVDPSNEAAIKLYESVGFIDTGKRVDHFGDGADRMLMSLLIPAGEAPPFLPQVPQDGLHSGSFVRRILAGPAVLTRRFTRRIRKASSHSTPETPAAPR